MATGFLQSRSPFIFHITIMRINFVLFLLSLALVPTIAAGFRAGIKEKWKKMRDSANGIKPKPAPSSPPSSSKPVVPNNPQTQSCIQSRAIETTTALTPPPSVLCGSPGHPHHMRLTQCWGTKDSDIEGSGKGPKKQPKKPSKKPPR